MSILDANTLAAGFASVDLAVRLHVFDHLPSTQQYLKNHANAFYPSSIATAYQAELCICDWQTDGSGRRGRSWVSQSGNLTMSLLTHSQRNPSALMGLSLVSGISISETIHELTGFPVNVKWPNDIILCERKLGGILVDLLPQQRSGWMNVVTGLGINYQEDEENLRSLGIGGTSLSEHGEMLPSRDDMIVALVQGLIEAYQIFERDGWVAFADRWKSVDYLKGKVVEIQKSADENVVGQAAGVAPDGALLVDIDGQQQRVHSAEVSVRLASTVS